MRIKPLSKDKELKKGSERRRDGQRVIWSFGERARL